MKTISNKILILLSVVFAFYSCSDDDMTYKDAKVTAVNKLYAPTNDLGVQLLSSSTASLLFEWEASKVEDSGSPLYEVLFDKIDGDFSNPIYRLSADNGGARNFATVKHVTLNKICGFAGIGSGGTGKVKWTVVTSRGINEAMAKESRQVEITRLVGFEVIPSQLFVTGEGSEGGTSVADALDCASPAQGVFEIFTKLEAGKAYQFIDKKVAGGDTRTFNLVEGKIIEEAATVAVAKTGVYRLVLDFEMASYTITEIKSFGFFFSPENKVTLLLDYEGKGVWKGQGDIAFFQASWGKDERYKFQMEIVDAAGVVTTQQWGAKNDTDSRPNSSSPPSYYFMKEVPTSQDSQKWKLADEMDGAKVEFTVSLTGTDYTHVIKKIG